MRQGIRNEEHVCGHCEEWSEDWNGPEPNQEGPKQVRRRIVVKKKNREMGSCQSAGLA